MPLHSLAVPALPAGLLPTADSQLRHTLLKKHWHWFLEQRDTFQECKLVFCLFGFFFPSFSELAGKAESREISQPCTCLEKEGGIGGDFRGTASSPVGVLRFAQQVADLTLLHGSNPDVPCLDHLAWERGGHQEGTQNRKTAQEGDLKKLFLSPMGTREPPVPLPLPRLKMKGSLRSRLESNFLPLASLPL